MAAGHAVDPQGGRQLTRVTELGSVDRSTCWIAPTSTCRTARRLPRTLAASLAQWRTAPVAQLYERAA